MKNPLRALSTSAKPSQIKRRLLFEFQKKYFVTTHKLKQKEEATTADIFDVISITNRLSDAESISTDSKVLSDCDEFTLNSSIKKRVYSKRVPKITSQRHPLDGPEPPDFIEDKTQRFPDSLLAEIRITETIFQETLEDPLLLFLPELHSKNSDGVVLNQLRQCS